MSTPDDLTPHASPHSTSFERQGRVSRRCSVCQSAHAAMLDRMLTGHVVKRSGGRYTLAEISQWAAAQGAPTSKAALSRHWTQHLQPAPEGQEEAAESQAVPRISGHIRKAAEVLVRGVFEQVREEFARAMLEAAETTRVNPPAQVAQVAAPAPVTAQEAPQDDHPARVPLSTAAPRSEPSWPRKRGERAIPRDYQSALKLEAELNRVQAMPSGMRSALLKALAKSHGVHPRTAYRWLEEYEAHGLAGIAQLKRSDAGGWRLPPETVRIIHAFIEGHARLSGRKIHELLLLKHPEIMEGRTGAREGKPVSVGTIMRMKKRLKASDAQLERESLEADASADALAE